MVDLERRHAGVQAFIFQKGRNKSLEHRWRSIDSLEDSVVPARNENVIIGYGIRKMWIVRSAKASLNLL